MRGDGSRPPSSGSSFEGTYAPGMLLRERYRIVALVGEGGMGEVYLADDITLDQEVALKFLPAHIAEREGGLERFFSEVRIARRVTHANVARVHDIGEVDGRHFLSMEFVDGEDLAHLLRRIGRLPQEKALDIALQLCAALTSAHAEGVLHRDLKPANVMLDGEGRVRVTDFGLAVLKHEQQVGGSAGTPAYMSPEQLAGKAIDERSEVYSLGLVLYELFTGQRVFTGRTIEEIQRQHLGDTPSSPSSVIDDMDPAVERVLMRCLEKEPSRRPPSVRAVTAGLPGGDPLAAAMAAGETPAPELLAEAGERGGLGPRVALPLFLLSILLLVGVVATSGTVGLISRVDPPLSSEVLVHRAEELMQRLGYDDLRADHAYGFYINAAQVNHREELREEQESPEALDPWQGLAEAAPSSIRFWYRQSPQLMNPEDGFQISYYEPAHTRPGMVRVVFDAHGRLTRLSAVPASHTEVEAESSPPDWTAVLDAAGLSVADFEESTPVWTPDVNTDHRRAWRGVYPGPDAYPVQVECASFQGTPVFFEIGFPWEEPPVLEAERPSPGEILQSIFGAALGLGVLLATAFLARRNLIQKRADRKGADRLAVLAILLNTVWWFVGVHYLPTGAMLGLFFKHFGLGLFPALLLWLLYLALEPYFRRLWPLRIVSWVRMIDGRARDPLVGRDLLIGVCYGLGLCVVNELEFIQLWTGGDAPRPSFNWAGATTLYGSTEVVGVILSRLNVAVIQCLALAVCLLLLRLLLRKQWIAVTVLFGIPIVTSLVSSASHFDTIGLAVYMASFFLVLLRVGLLAVVTGVYVSLLLGSLPLTLDLSRWYAGSTVAATVLVGGLAAWGTYVALAGRQVFRDLLND